MIFLCETWHTSASPSISIHNNFFDCLSVNAIKNKTMGRASGGLMILFNPLFYKIDLLHESNFWIIILIDIDGTKLIIGLTYFNPSCDTETVFPLFEDIISDICSRFPKTPVLIGGDFNCRLGNMNQIPIDIILDNPNFSNYRSSLDSFTDRKKDQLLIDLFTNNDFLLLNGRLIRDSPAHFTYLDTQGKSVIDLVWCSFLCLPFLDDVYVTVHSTRSDHSPSVVSLHKNFFVKPVYSDNVDVAKYKWNNEKSCLLF